MFFLQVGKLELWVPLLVYKNILNELEPGEREESSMPE